MKLSEYMRNVIPGDMILIEHPSISLAPRVFHVITRSAGRDNLFIIDVLDSALTLKKELELAGVDVSYLEKAPRLMGSGKSKWGRVVMSIDVHSDPGIFMSKFERFSKKYYSEHPGVNTIIVNPERIIPLHHMSPRFVLSLADLAAVFLGNRNRNVYYFVNCETADRRYLSLLEEVFTKVLRLKGRRLTVEKSPRPEEEGLELELG